MLFRHHTIEFRSKTTAKSVDEFIEKIKVEDSKFSFLGMPNGEYRVEFKTRMFQRTGIFPCTNLMVYGEIGEEVINTFEPRIIVKPTRLVAIFLIILLSFYIVMFIAVLSEFDLNLFWQ